ncbi:MAG: hypothetical protein ACE5E8_02490 [Acidimicrobiia bacterium]
MSTNDVPEADAEDYEDVPWSDLLGTRRAQLPKVGYGIAAVLGAVALVVVVMRLGGTSRPEPIELTPAPSTGSPSPAASAVPAPVTTAAELPAVVVTEADLAALSADTPQLVAATARAEWFVRDYFTVDQDPQGSASIRRALPDGVALPDLPQDAVDPAGMAYVEWAKAYEVHQVAPEVFQVAVAFGSLSAPADGRFTRLPPRLVVVHVAVSTDLASVVLDLPQPVGLPPPPPLTVVTGVGATPPPTVLEAATDLLASWGMDPEVTAATATGGVWRVEATVADATGHRWPLVLWLTDAGTQTDPQVEASTP